MPQLSLDGNNCWIVRSKIGSKTSYLQGFNTFCVLPRDAIIFKDYDIAYYSVNVLMKRYKDEIIDVIPLYTELKTIQSKTK